MKGGKTGLAHSLESLVHDQLATLLWVCPDVAFDGEITWLLTSLPPESKGGGKDMGLNMPFKVILHLSSLRCPLLNQSASKAAA